MKAKLEWKQPNNKYKCPVCGKESTRTGIVNHYHHAHLKDMVIWNKGLTKETDNRIRQSIQTFKQNIRFGNVVPGMKGKMVPNNIRRKISKNLKKYLNNNPRLNGPSWSKSGWYKGYWCDSTWELAFVIYHLDHKIPFKRNTKGFEYNWKGNKHLYFPNFVYPDGTYVEVKGIVDEISLEKLNNFHIK